MKARFFGAVGVAASLLFTNPLQQPLHAQRGQPIYPVYDGFVKNPDGSFTLSFAYFSHNAEPVPIPPGANNSFEPAPADRQQPTTFLPGHWRFQCVMVVGPEFDGKLRWTLSHAGFPGLGDDTLQLDATLAEFEVTTQRVSTWNRKPYPPNSTNIGLSIARWPHSDLMQVVKDAEGNFYGIHRLPTPMFIDVVKKMNRYGYRPGFHISGDAALDWHLDAYEAADRDLSIKGKRWVAEHNGGDYPEQTALLIKLEMVLSLQRQLGPLRRQLDSGLIVSLGSDWPAFSNNPFDVMALHITRKNAQGNVVDPSQKITRAEALRMATINNAYMTFKEKKTGSIEAGKLADFLILDADIMTVPEDQIKSILPLATYVGGKKVFSRSGGGF